MTPTTVVCVTLLYAQFAHHRHQRSMQSDRSALGELAERVTALEERGASEFDQSAFDELKTKVEGMRLAQGLRGK